jgi:N-methylhydantoinase B
VVEPGDVLHFITWGGGGWGEPLERDPELVLQDVRRGLVTVAGARAYGVVVAEDQIDQIATSRLREEMRARLGSAPTFTHGGSIDELRSRCLEETGLPAPLDPGRAAASPAALPVVAPAAPRRPVLGERQALEALVEQIARSVVLR